MWGGRGAKARLTSKARRIFLVSGGKIAMVQSIASWLKRLRTLRRGKHIERDGERKLHPSGEGRKSFLHHQCSPHRTEKHVFSPPHELVLVNAFFGIRLTAQPRRESIFILYYVSTYFAFLYPSWRVPSLLKIKANPNLTSPWTKAPHFTAQTSLCFLYFFEQYRRNFRMGCDGSAPFAPHLTSM